MFNNIWESLLFSTEDFNKPEEKEEKFKDQSSNEDENSQSNENLEQNDIKSVVNDDYSFEDFDDNDGSFEEAADEGGNSGSNDQPADEPSMDDMNMDDMDMGDMDSDMGGDDGDSGDGGSDGSSDSDDSDGGINFIDNNKGSSLNPYTQINQKMYCIDRLNDLENSISGAIDIYSTQYADWSEVDQLRELKSFVQDQKRSFIMQQNPENLIKIGLYYETYDQIVQNLCDKIEAKHTHDKEYDKQLVKN